MLFKYTPGASLSLATFSRASTATYVDANGIVQTASSGVARDGHYIGGVRSMLLEGQRTNLVIQSQLSGWGQTRATLTVNAVTGPDGATSAATLIEDTTASATHTGRAGASATLVNATAYAVSVFAKPNGRTWIDVFGDDVAVHMNGSPQYFNLSGAGSAGATATGVTAKGITQLASTSWYRSYLTATSSGTTASMDIGLATADGANSYTGNGVSGANLFGAQIEAGAFPTSYIPTTAAAVTRAVDALSFPGVATGASATLFYRYWDLATSAWVDVVAAYTSATAIVPPVDRAYQTIAVLSGTYNAAQAAALLGVA